MTSVWSDDAPSRESILIRPGDKSIPEIRKHYGFDEINKTISLSEVEMHMESACRTLIWLLQDVRDYDKGLASQDARELVHLICCLYRCLISAFKTEAETFHGGPSEQFKHIYDHLGSIIEKAESRIRSIASHLVPTSRTLMELITRIIAQHCDEPPSLEMYEDKLRNLRVSKKLSADRKNRPDRNYIGISVVVFVCIHTTDTNEDGAGPQHVIGSSKEQWPGVPKLKSMHWGLRNQRLQDLMVLKIRTKSVWDVVKRRHEICHKTHQKGNALKRALKRPEAERTEDSILRARKAAVAEFQRATQDSEKSSHHDEDQAAAFYMPSGKLGGRCFKCQCLHPFTMHPEAKVHESADENILLPLNMYQERLHFNGYPAGACAEDLVFPCCQAVNRSHRPQPTTAIGAKGAGQRKKK